MRPALWSRDPDARASGTRRTLDRTPDADRARPSVRVATRAGRRRARGSPRRGPGRLSRRVRATAAIGYDFGVARVELDAVLLLGSDAPELRAVAEEARAVFERVGARPYLDWLTRPRPDRPRRADRVRSAQPSDREVVGRS